MLQMTVGAVQEGEAGHGKDAAEGEQETELSRLQNDHRKVHHRQAETDEPETERQHESDQPLLFRQRWKTLGEPRRLAVGRDGLRVEVSGFFVKVLLRRSELEGREGQRFGEADERAADVLT
jgi:hypothetical protein